MKFYLVTEPMVRNRHWANLYDQGIHREATARKCDLLSLRDGLFPSSAGSILLMNGVSRRWITNGIRQAFEKGLRPLVLAPIQQDLGASSICLDFYGAYSGLLEDMQISANRIAFVGAVMTSYTDELKLLAFFDRGGSSSSVFHNRGNLHETFAEFAARQQEFDGVLCTNDVLLLALMKYLGNSAERLRFGAISNTLTAHNLPTNRIFLADFDCICIGQQAVRLAGYMQRNPEIKEIHEKVWSNRNVAKRLPVPPVPVDFYSDQLLDDLFRYERMMVNCTSLDQQILREITQKMPYFRIAANHYISESTVKYRLLRLCRLSGFSSLPTWKRWLCQIHSVWHFPEI